jgi:hypothetical protein
MKISLCIFTKCNSVFFLYFRTIYYLMSSGFELRIIISYSIISVCRLDVAAIQAELPWKMDYNSEIKTVGRSNIISGVFGGEDATRKVRRASVAVMSFLGCLELRKIGQPKYDWSWTSKSN